MIKSTIRELNCVVFDKTFGQTVLGIRFILIRILESVQNSDPDPTFFFTLFFIKNVMLQKKLFCYLWANESVFLFKKYNILVILVDFLWIVHDVS